MSVSIPGGRTVEATLDEAGDDRAPPQDACVVACPPHPQHGGHRGDSRLESVSDALGDRGVDCLRIDYGEWDEGYGEREDARNAIRWAADRYDHVGCFGYSFGGSTILLAAATVGRAVRGVSALAPAARLAADLDAVDAVADLDCPIQVIYGDRDDLVDAAEVAEAVRERGGRTDVRSFSADHFFVGQQSKIGALVAEFLVDALAPADG